MMAAALHSNRMGQKWCEKTISPVWEHNYVGAGKGTGRFTILKRWFLPDCGRLALSEKRGLLVHQMPVAQV